MENPNAVLDILSFKYAVLGEIMQISTQQATPHELHALDGEMGVLYTIQV